MIARLHDLRGSADGRQLLTVEILDGDFRDHWDGLKDSILDLVLKKHREKRSRNANDYLWVLCEALARNQGITKVEVYRKNIREVGVCEVLGMSEEAYGRFSSAWCERGLGWFSELADTSAEGECTVLAYYGSSTYTSADMARLIEAVQEDCRACGVETATPDELSLLMEDWDAKHRAEHA